jgi:hypothetical protein
MWAEKQAHEWLVGVLGVLGLAPSTHISQITQKVLKGYAAYDKLSSISYWKCIIGMTQCNILMQLWVDFSCSDFKIYSKKGVWNPERQLWNQFFYFITNSFDVEKLIFLSIKSGLAQFFAQEIAGILETRLCYDVQTLLVGLIGIAVLMKVNCYISSKLEKKFGHRWLRIVLEDLFNVMKMSPIRIGLFLRGSKSGQWTKQNTLFVIFKFVVQILCFSLLITG